MPACLAITTEREFACPLHPACSASLCGCERHDLVRCEWQWTGWEPFSGGFRCGIVIGLCDWPCPLTVICFTQCQTQSGWRGHPHYVKGCQRARARMVWGAISQQAGRVVSSGAASGSPTNARPPSSPKYTTSSRNRGAPPTRLTSVFLLQLVSHPLTALNKRDTSTCLLWMSLWPHISARPQLSDGKRVRAIQAVQSHICTRWMCLLGGWTSGFSALLDGCAPGLSGQGARQWGSWSGVSFTQGPEERDRPGSTTKATAQATSDSIRTTLESLGPNSRQAGLTERDCRSPTRLTDASANLCW